MPIKTQSYNKSTKNTKEKILTKQGYIFYDKTIKMNLSDLPKNLSEKLINFNLKICLGIAYATPALHMQRRPGIAYTTPGVAYATPASHMRRRPDC